MIQISTNNDESKKTEKQQKEDKLSWLNPKKKNAILKYLDSEEDVKQ